MLGGVRSSDVAYIVGTVFVILGLVIIAFGDRTVQEKGGIVLKIFSRRSRSGIHLVKWVFGLSCIWLGLMILSGKFPP
jgi:hypothetical protein